MQRRGFLKALGAAVAAMAMPVSLTMLAPVQPLAPLVKIPLATIDSSIRWMQLIYNGPPLMLYEPVHPQVMINVGEAKE